MAGEKFSWRKAFASVMGATLLLVGVPALTVSAAGVDDFPYRGTVNRLDPWGFYTGYCTSFVAFRLSQEGVRLQGASLQGPNGKTAFFGNGGSWVAAVFDHSTHRDQGRGHGCGAGTYRRWALHRPIEGVLGAGSGSGRGCRCGPTRRPLIVDV